MNAPVCKEWTWLNWLRFYSDEDLTPRVVTARFLVVPSAARRWQYAPRMLRTTAVVVAILASAAAARAETETPVTRADVAAGFATGDGASSFSLHAHLGRSVWALGAPDPGSHWRTALRLTAGAAVSSDLSGSGAFLNVAPFVEIGAGAASDARTPRQVTVFARAEPILVPGALGEGGVRFGVGVTLHGFRHVWMPKPATDDEDLAQDVLIPFALPVLGLLNVRHLEVTTDLGVDGRMQYGVVIGIGR